MAACRLGRLNDLLVRCIRAPVADVGLNRVLKQVDILKDNRNFIEKAVGINRCNVFAVDENLSLAVIIKTGRKPEYGCFSAAGRPDKRGNFILFRRKRNTVDNLLSIVIRKLNIFKLNTVMLQRSRFAFLRFCFAQLVYALDSCIDIHHLCKVCFNTCNRIHNTGSCNNIADKIQKRRRASQIHCQSKKYGNADGKL